MDPTLPPPERLNAAYLARDPAFDGRVVIAIRSTGIFCRLSCPSRRALPRNRLFLPDAASARAAGFRPCRRCRPETSSGHEALGGR